MAKLNEIGIVVTLLVSFGCCATPEKKGKLALRTETWVLDSLSEVGFDRKGSLGTAVSVWHSV